MAIEIERKFLVRKDDWRRPGQGLRYRQGYLTIDPSRTVRVRLAGEEGFLTIKGKSDGMSRSEFEYTIPVAEANEMLDSLCFKPLIEKIRYRLDHCGHLWEVDEFEGDNQGLILAEVELARVDEVVELPPWAGREVTDDPRYYNASLSRNPYRTWTENDAMTVAEAHDKTSQGETPP